MYAKIQTKSVMVVEDNGVRGMIVGCIEEVLRLSTRENKCMPLE